MGRTRYQATGLGSVLICSKEKYLKNFLSGLADTRLSEEEQIMIIDHTIQIILADNQSLYSEVKFFKNRNRMSITDENYSCKASMSRRFPTSRYNG